jgi:hypothetical protein
LQAGQVRKVPGFPASSLQGYLSLQEGSLLTDAMVTITMLVEVSMLALRATFSMTLIAQARNERVPFPYVKVAAVGAAAGWMYALLNGWHWPSFSFALLAGAANVAFPYSWYMHEIQSNPTSNVSPVHGGGSVGMTGAMKKHVQIGLGVGALLLVLNFFITHAHQRQEYTDFDQCGSWLSCVAQTVHSVSRRHATVSQVSCMVLKTWRTNLDCFTPEIKHCIAV